MKNGFLILATVFAFSANQIMTRIFQTKLQKTKNSINLYQALFTLAAALAYFGWSIAKGIPYSANILIPSLLFGVCFAFASLFLALCMDMGYMSLSAVIVNLSLILPVAFSWVVMKEDIKANAVAGLLFMMATLVLSSSGNDKEGGGDAKKWLLFVLVAFFANGCSAIVQKQYKVIYGGNDIMLLMAFAYLVSSIIFAVTYIIQSKKSGMHFCRQVKNPGLLLAIAVLSGLGSFGGNGLLAYLCDKVNGGLLYPCINGGLCIVVSICSFLFFKEKLSRKKLVAICTGTIAIILLNI